MQYNRIWDDVVPNSSLLFENNWFHVIKLIEAICVQPL